MSRSLILIASVGLAVSCGGQESAPRPSGAHSTSPEALTASPAVTEAASPEGVAFIRWNMTNETNIVEYRILRADSREGPWELIQTIPGAGAGINGAQHYEFEQRGLEIGRVVYYLIEHVDTEGRALPAGPIEYTIRPEAPLSAE